MPHPKRPPYYAVVSRSPRPGVDAGQFLDAGEMLVGLAAAEPGFLGVEYMDDPNGSGAYTVCYWDRPHAIQSWRNYAAERIPVRIQIDDIVCHEGCLWPWLHDVFDAVNRRDEETIVRFPDQKAVA